MKTHVSERGFPLVYQGIPPKGCAVLTVENYIKWYSLYAVTEEKTIAFIPPNINEIWCNHNFYPSLCEELVESKYDELGDLEVIWDENSLDMIYGRYYREIWNG